MLSLLSSAPAAKPGVATDPLGGGLRADAGADSAGAGAFADALQRSSDALQADGDDTDLTPAADDRGLAGVTDLLAGVAPTLDPTPIPAPLPAIAADIGLAAGLAPALPAEVPATAGAPIDPLAHNAIAAAAAAAIGGPAPAASAAPKQRTTLTEPLIQPTHRGASDTGSPRPTMVAPTPATPLPSPHTPITPAEGGDKPVRLDDPAPAASTLQADRPDAATPEIAPADVTAAEPASPMARAPTITTTPAIAPAPPLAAESVAPLTAPVAATVLADARVPSTAGARAAVPTPTAAALTTTRTGAEASADRATPRSAARTPAAETAGDRPAHDPLRADTADARVPVARAGAQAHGGRDDASSGERFTAAAAAAAPGTAPAQAMPAAPRFADQLQSLLVPATAAPAPTAAAPSFADAPTYSLPASPQSPEFAPAMGAQITLLAKDGVQQARIELNPVDLGPVLVQISLDGSAARVDFHAEVASTRQAIESSLPALAGSLRDAGMTLTGGGVFQQPQQQSSGRHGAEDGHRRHNGPGQRGNEGGPAAVSTTVRPGARRGLVDLVA
ncbi:flagellar hook-length control protein FliK [Aquincola sp. S2]|uniref:Flagellar hook-length control protein FliK n=1 Tax=Pseudaquabacterium terrae TaxID=2732868 RepID=A0ABX2EIR7_9BURK|nr:flagellar hook-length control protein FliK [Aquabacterium terrae]NRF68503.1 flagellar hook-length control protein FliK [Aquabacterium terrae]